MRILVALGGNALLHRDERPDADVQQVNVLTAAMAIAQLAAEHDVVLTHGNGPQVGMLALESAADPALSRPYPLDILGAQTQGMIGYLLGQALQNALPGKQVASLVTQTLVSVADPAFADPTSSSAPFTPGNRPPAWPRSAAGRCARTAPPGAGSCRHRARSGSRRPG
jgi:carbamate kinase